MALDSSELDIFGPCGKMSKKYNSMRDQIRAELTELLQQQLFYWTSFNIFFPNNIFIAFFLQTLFFYSNYGQYVSEIPNKFFLIYLQKTVKITKNMQCCQTSHNAKATSSYSFRDNSATVLTQEEIRVNIWWENRDVFNEVQWRGLFILFQSCIMWQDADKNCFDSIDETIK